MSCPNRRLLLPLSWLYGLVVAVRNRLFDCGALHSQSYDVPLLSVGNLTVGGTGKTPHIEYLIALLQRRSRVAVLSRGYRRRSKGFVEADAHSTVEQLGDEPFQMHRKFPAVRVAVCANRREGIARLMQGGPVDAILLDDAFQHRYVKPGLQILLVDYNRPIWRDALLPAGNLREPAAQKRRAQIVVVTKCPADLRPVDFRRLSTSLALYPYQQLYFTTMHYGRPWPVFGRGELPSKLPHVLLIAGIARPEPLIEELRRRASQVTPLLFADHHNYTPRDVALINRTFRALLDRGPAVAVTTEKDAARLAGRQGRGLSPAVRSELFAIPIEVAFLQNAEAKFNETILHYVLKHSASRHVAQ